MKTSQHLAVLVSAFALACGSSGSSEPATSGGGEHEEHGEGHGHHETGSPELDALHEELGPVWHGDHATACAHADSFHTHAVAVRAAAPPADADAAAWTGAGDTLVASSEALASECTAAGPAVEERLSAFHDAFHAAMEVAEGDHDEDHDSDEDHEVDEAAAHARGEHHDHDGESDEHAHH